MSEPDGTPTGHLSGEELPNSAAQRERLRDIARQGAVGHLAHCVTVALEIRGAVSMVALQAGVDHVLRRRPALRSVFQADGDIHRIAEGPTTYVHRVAAGGDTFAERWAAAYALARAEAYRPIPVGQTPLLRATLFDAAERQLLLLKIDQLACDAWSANLIVDEVVSAADRSAREQPPVLAEPDEYAQAQRARHARVDAQPGRAAVARRRAAIDGHTLRWPLRWERDPQQTEDLVEQVADLDIDVTAAFLSRIRSCGGSVFSAAVLAFAVANLGPADRVALTSTFACRETKAEEGAVGWFSNEVAIPLPPLVGTVSEALRALRTRLAGALNDQAAPHPLVVGNPPGGDRPGGLTVSLLYLPAQLAGGDQTSMRIGAATVDRTRVTICPTGADVDLYVVEKRADTGGPALSLGTMSGRGGLGREALAQLLDQWRAAITRLGRMDWRTEQVRPAVRAAS